MRMRALAATSFSLVSLTHVAHAEDAAPRPAAAPEAKRLFEEGRKALAEGRIGPACEAFAEAKRLAPEACGVVQNLAMCREQQGRYVDANAELDALTACAQHANQPDRVKFAEDQRSALRPKLAFLSVLTSVGTPRVTKLYLDGALIEGEGARALEPGRHRVEVEREGCAPDRLEATVVAGQTQVLTLSTCGSTATAAQSVTTSAPAAPVATRAPVAVEPVGTRGVRWQVPVGWTAVALGGLGLLASVVPCGAIALANDDRSTANVCTAVGISGGVVLGAGIVFLLAAPRAQAAAKPRAWNVAPHLAGTRAVSLEATFHF